MRESCSASDDAGTRGSERLEGSVDVTGSRVELESTRHQSQRDGDTQSDSVLDRSIRSSFIVACSSLARAALEGSFMLGLSSIGV